MFGPTGALLPEEAEYTPVEYQGHAEGHGKRDKYPDNASLGPSPSHLWNYRVTPIIHFSVVSDTVEVRPKGDCGR